MKIGLSYVGTKKLFDAICGLTDHIVELTPTEFNEEHRFIPSATSSKPGPFLISKAPYWEEPLNNLDPRDPTRETIIKKGVQVGFNVSMIESAIFYQAAYLRTYAGIFASLDKDMAHERMEANVIPMFTASDHDDIFRSTDVKSKHKTGKTKNHLQWLGGGYLLVYGATNVNKIRSFGVPCLYLDEVDAEQWEGRAAGGGDKIALFFKRCRAFWDVRKIIIGSSPLLDGSSRIEREFKRGDQREYQCRCLKCGYPKTLRFSGTDKESGRKYGFKWDYLGNGQLDVGSVRYECKNCGNPHEEKDKPKFINKSNSFWKPTAVSIEPNVRSYHVPGFLSLFSPWHEMISDWLRATDPKTGKVVDVGALQNVYNNHFGEVFKLLGGKLKFETVSSHRRRFYSKGEILNREIEKVCPSGILFLTCTVDVHKSNLAVAVWGWTENFCCWLIDYDRFEDLSETGCDVIESEAWGRLQDLIDNRVFVSDDGKAYQPVLTLIDAGYNNNLVVDFCSQWESGVLPIVGRDRPDKQSRISDFTKFTTQIGSVGYKIVVDYYKDRLSAVLRRIWHDAEGHQKKYTFNAPVDTTDAELKELTREVRREKKLPNGEKVYYWHRLGGDGVRNELWDLMVYAHASVEMVAWHVMQDFDLETIDWFEFWNFAKRGEYYVFTA